MNELLKHINEAVDLELPGKIVLTGYLTDVGSDIVVLYNGKHYLYIPAMHIHHIRRSGNSEEISESTGRGTPFDNQPEPISYRKMLTHAKGLFVELYIAGNQTIHGYLTSIMNDYFIFHSPVFHTLYISLNHLKYLIPYNPSLSPYSLGPEHFPVRPSNLSLARTFDQQLKKFEGKFIVLDLVEDPDKIGLLKRTEGGLLELVTANGDTVFWNLQHLKTVHVP